MLKQTELSGTFQLSAAILDIAMGRRDSSSVATPPHGEVSRQELKVLNRRRIEGIESARRTESGSSVPSIFTVRGLLGPKRYDTKPMR